jgi:hypothetical protein
LVAHSLWERGAVGSNPATPTRSGPVRPIFRAALPLGRQQPCSNDEDVGVLVSDRQHRPVGLCPSQLALIGAKASRPGKAAATAG